MLLDEPTRALDVQGRREFWAAMRAFAASGRTVVFATHYLDEVEENADRVVVLARGRIVADAAPAEIRAGHGSATVRFRLPGEDAAPGAVDLLSDSGLPESFGAAAFDGDWVTIRTGGADAAVRALAASSLPWQDLSVIPPSLDDSFLQLTSEEIR
jgi:ABC-2 type transport system ATP-binding protein